MRGKEEEMESKNELMKQEWLRQDDQGKLQRELRTTRAKQFVEGEEMDRLQGEMTSRMSRLQLARDAKVQEIERARAVRLAKEQAEEALEASRRSGILLRKHQVAAATETAAVFAEKGVAQVLTHPPIYHHHLRHCCIFCGC